ncbi:MAG: sulfurtransferase complex subunit TusB [Gammaproteobacteria bacterium]|nr:sulfurtransferase complex subunit TusB [Gammaproteobacteria bacterium]
MLHIVNKSPFATTALASCLRVAKPGSTILLIEDGVYGALDGTRNSDAMREALADRTVCVLGADAAARGVADKLLDGIDVVDYDGFVDLVAADDGVQSWL